MRAVFRDDIFFPLANPQTSSVCSIKITAVKELHSRFSLRAPWFPVALSQSRNLADSWDESGMYSLKEQAGKNFCYCKLS